MAGQLEILHVDMDCFFASVEAHDDPRLSGVPLVVGGTGQRGVVCSASYEARAFGVRSAMPTGEARRLCPHAVYVAPRHSRYAEVSAAMHALLHDVTPLVEPIGLDEAFLDVSGSHRLLGSSEVIARAIRARIAAELGLPCSLGVGRTKLIAKLASKAAKPGSPAARYEGGRLAGDAGGEPVAPGGCGVVVVDAAGELAFLHRHPVRALPGVGPRTAERLRRFGVSTVGDLAAVPVDSLERVLGGAHGAALHALATGCDTSRVVADRPLKSIGHEETFERDLRDPAELARRARDMAVSVASGCRRSGLLARTVTLKLKYGDFTLQTRARTLPAPSADAIVLGDAAVELLGEARAHAGVRLLGVSASSLVEPTAGPEQLELFGPGPGVRPGADAGGGSGGPDVPRGPGPRPGPAGRRVDAGHAAELVRARFGAAAIRPASSPAPSGRP